MTRILPPRAVKPLAYLLMAMYGPGGSGKTLLALKTAHRLAAPVGGDIVLIDADEGRSEFYPEFAFRPEPFRDVFSTKRLIQVIDSYTEMVREAPGSVVLIIDSLSPFWAKNGGLQHVNNIVNAKKFGGNTWSAWSVTGPQEEEPLYAAMRRFTKYGHMVLCLEESPDYNGNDLVGVKPHFRTGFSHRVDFLVRVERYMHQADTKRQAKPEDAAQDSHRAIIEKVSIARTRPNPDGTVESEYPVATGTVIPNPNGEIGARLLEYLNEGAGNYEEVIAEYLESIKDADRDGLLKAYDYAKRVTWPEEYREQLKDGITALGSKFKAPEAPVAAPVEGADRPPEQYFWSDLTHNHPVDEWMHAAEELDNNCESEIELDAFLAWAKQCERWDNVHELIYNRKEEVAHERLSDDIDERSGLTANDIF